MIHFFSYSATQCLLKWQNFQRFYLYVLTENVKSIILKHRKVLLSEDVKRQYNLNERDIAAAATLPELDDAYTRRLHNFPSTNELYKWSSCINYLPNIEKPIIFLNALDDPLVPEVLLHPIRKFAGELSFNLSLNCFNLILNYFNLTPFCRVTSQSVVHWKPTRRSFGLLRRRAD